MVPLLYIHFRFLYDCSLELALPSQVFVCHLFTCLLCVTGIHRYIFLVYKQPPNYTPTEAYRPRNRERRYLWSVRQFAKDNNLGDPVAGNFYRAEFDSYVPTLHAELSAATPQV